MDPSCHAKEFEFQAEKNNSAEVIQSSVCFRDMCLAAMFKMCIRAMGQVQELLVTSAQQDLEIFIILDGIHPLLMLEN